MILGADLILRSLLLLDGLTGVAAPLIVLNSDVAVP